MQRTLALLFGRVWWTYGLALVFGLSTIYVSAVWWFSPALLILPALAFSIACIHAHLWWRATAARTWLVWSVVALCLGLLFYEKTVLVPVFLFLMRVFLLYERAPVARTLRAALREWRIWLLYLIPIALYLAVVIPGGYQAAGAIHLDAIPLYLRTAWLEAFAPAVFGAVIPKRGATAWQELAVDLAQVAIFATVAVSVIRRPAAWRAWTVLGVMFVLNALVVLPRVTTYGLDIAYVTRYYTETALVVPFVLAFAFSAPRGRRDRAGLSLRPPRGAAAVWASVGFLFYLALVMVGDHDTVQASVGRHVRPWVARLQAGLDRARHLDRHPVLLDARVPNVVVPGFVRPPANLLSAVVPTFDDSVRINVVAPARTGSRRTENCNRSPSSPWWPEASPKPVVAEH
jgi:hypothetical protein